MAADQEVPRVPGSPSLYRKVAEDIKAAIAAGGYAAGTRLPSEHELAERYSVSRGTVRQAFAALRADGIIASRRGARRVVVGGPRVQSFGELLSFSRWARAMGEVPGGRVIAIRRRAAKPAEAERLALPPGVQVYHLTRVRLLSGHPVMIERGVYPDRVGVLVAGMELEKDSITERTATSAARWRSASATRPRSTPPVLAGHALYHRSEVEPGVVLVTGPGGRGMTCSSAIAEETFR